MSASPSTIDAVAPPWPLIHFDVHCARCGHDLRGQSEPVCPVCKLEFTWDQAAPLEELTCGKCSYHLYGIADSRCPECGTPVDWNEALLRHRRREKPLFEYHWRDRPIRSFFGTWLLALRPRRLWKTVDIHDPPQVRPLLFWAIVLLGITTISVPFWSGMHMTIGGILAFGPMNWSSSLDYLIQNWMVSLASAALWGWAISYALWCVFGFGALLIFQQSMRRCRVRIVHVLRACAYGMTPLMPLFLVLSIGLDLILDTLAGSQFELHGLLKLSLAAISYIWLVWSIRQAYRHYIRMPHALGVAIASQIIAVLATWAIPRAIINLISGGW